MKKKKENIIKSYFKNYFLFSGIQMGIDFLYFMNVLITAILTFGMSLRFYGGISIKLIKSNISKIYFIEKYFSGTLGGVTIFTIFLLIILIQYLILGFIIGKMYYFINSKNKILSKISVAVVYLILSYPLDLGPKLIR